MKNKLGQLFMIGLKGPELTTEEAQFIVKNNISGVTLFARNLQSPQQIHKLCFDLQQLRLKQPEQAPLFIGIDMEGGRVHRLKAPFTQWPALRRLGELDVSSLAFKFAMAMAAELKAVGINLDYAPCVDIYTNPKNEIIGDRSLGSDPELVSKLSSALVRGYIKGGIVSCAKHFPGHGNTLLDSHEDLPIEDTDFATLDNRELIPFKKAFRARLDMVMTAHIKFKNIDPEWPVTLSEKFLKQLLRKELRFRNIIISDDLDMKALAKHYSVEDTAVLAAKAGCDMLLYCNEFDSPPRGLEAVQRALEAGKLDSAQLEESYERVMRVKREGLVDCLPGDFKEAASLIGHPDHLKLKQAIIDGQIPEELLRS